MKRTRRLVRLELGDHRSNPTCEVLEKAYARQMEKLKSNEFPSEKKQQRARKRLSRAFIYLMKLRVKEESVTQVTIPRDASEDPKLDAASEYSR